MRTRLQNVTVVVYLHLRASLVKDSGTRASSFSVPSEGIAEYMNKWNS